MSTRDAVRRVSADPRLRRSMGLVPSALTILNIALGYLAIVKSFEADFLAASLLVLAAGVVDKFDGAVARATGTASDFGRELDSLADVISFGVAPSLLVFEWALRPFGEIGLGVAFLFTGCGALRLARFNNQPGASDRRHTVGLTVPAAASLPATFVFAHAWKHAPGTRLDDPRLAPLALAALAAVSFLMVSRLRYRSFKDFQPGRQDRWRLLLAVVAFIAVGLKLPHVLLPALSLAYVSSGPLVRLGFRSTRRDAPASAAPSPTEGGGAPGGGPP